MRGERNELNIDGVDLVLLNPGPTHGSGNLAAYFAQEKTLYSSDTILASAKYGFMPYYLMGGWGLEDTPEPVVLLADQVTL